MLLTSVGSIFFFVDSADLQSVLIPRFIIGLQSITLTC